MPHRHLYIFFLLLVVLVIPASSLLAADSPRASARPTFFSSLFASFSGQPVAPNGLPYDPKMLAAAEIAESKARSYSVRRCWRYVKNALLEAEVVDHYPGTAYAKYAGAELTSKFGFKKIPVNCPYDAPVGSVLVYGGRGAGHVEIRTRKGFVSDYASAKPSPRPLIGVYVKPRTRTDKG